MTLRELASAVGVTEPRIQSVEAGRRDPDYVLLVRIARALDVAAATLVVRAEELTARRRVQRPPGG
jgi:transcriptional regulator with XRE-family HTH domain